MFFDQQVQTNIGYIKGGSDIEWKAIQSDWISRMAHCFLLETSINLYLVKGCVYSVQLPKHEYRSHDMSIKGASTMATQEHCTSYASTKYPFQEGKKN